MATYIKEFEVLSTLGTGSFSSVYKVKRISDGQIYALKKVKLPNLKFKERINALNEIRILASINHPNVVAYKQAFYDEGSSSLCIIMEHASGGDLLKKIQDFKKKGTHIPEDLIWSYIIQMVQGLRALHNMKILHRDLKCANIFLGDDGTVKLGDLNVSRVVEEGLVKTQAGTPYYASPEIWQLRPYGAKSDIWSLGCIIYELCTFLPPFRAATMELLFQKIVKGNYEKIPATYSTELSKVIGMCLNVNAPMRPCCEKLISHSSLAGRMSEVDAAVTKKPLPVWSDLISTIKMPKNLKNLTEILPKSKYNIREVVSMVDLDVPAPKKYDYKPALISELRPSTRTGRVLNDKLSLNNISENEVATNKKDSLESSLERNMKLEDTKPTVIRQVKRITSLTPNIAKKTPAKFNTPNKLAPIAKISTVESNIFKPKLHKVLPASTNCIDVLVEEMDNCGVISPRQTGNILAPSGTKRGLDLFQNEVKESGLVRKESSIFQSNNDIRRALKPVF